jgi:hypothetical protein
MQQQLALICCRLSTSILTFNYVPRLESPAESNNNCTRVSHDAVAAASSQKAERKFQKERKKEKDTTYRQTKALCKITSLIAAASSRGPTFFPFFAVMIVKLIMLAVFLFPLYVYAF